MRTVRECRTCGKPLGKRRLRQGMSVHPRCRSAALDAATLEEALLRVEQVVDQLAEHAGRQEPELGEIEIDVRDAARQARALLGDLRRYKDFFALPRKQ